MTEHELLAALDELVPDCADAFGDWQDVLRRARITSASSPLAGVAEPAARRRIWTRRRLIAAGILATLVVALVATPAFGLRALLLDLIGRSDVRFGGGKIAPYEIRRDFFDLTLFAPKGMAPEAIASQARRVGVFRAAGKSHVLYVAPTRNGGYCWMFSEGFGGCRATRTRPHGYPSQRGAVDPFLLGLTWEGTPFRLSPQGRVVPNAPQYTKLVGGDILATSAHTLDVEYENGTKTPIPFTFVSKPIDAGFFLYAIPRGHAKPGTRVSAVTLLDARGRVLARQPITYELPRAPRRPPPARIVPPVRLSPKLPAPTPPLQHGSAGGVGVTAGRNGVAIFALGGASSSVRGLIAGRGVGYGCFRFMRYHEDAPAELGFERTTLYPRVSIQSPLPTPFDGCEIQGGYGHAWPDRNHSHSAVEIAFDARARRFFLDRAAARDLALFVRSRELHRLRKLSGDALAAALARRYGSALIRLATTATALPGNRIGYAVRPERATFVERSPTGRRFYVIVSGGRIVRANVAPLAFVF